MEPEGAAERVKFRSFVLTRVFFPVYNSLQEMFEISIFTMEE